MDIETIKTDINIDKIYDEINTFILNEDKYQEQLNDLVLTTQICLQGTHEEMEPYFGSRNLQYIKDKGLEEHDFNIFLFPKLIYTNSILEELNMFRTRIMIAKSKTCLSYHVDPLPRIHIPVKTNPHCFLVIDGICHHLPADGSAYLCDVTKWHTAMNASFNHRIHIVGVTED